MARKLRMGLSTVVHFIVVLLIVQRSTSTFVQPDVPEPSPSPFAPDNSIGIPSPTPLPLTPESPDTPEVDVLPPSDDFSPPSPVAQATTPALSEEGESPPAPPGASESSFNETLSPVQSDVPTGTGKHGLTGGAKAGIAFGVILGIFFGCGSVYIYRTRQENVKRSQLAHMHPMRI